MKKLLAIIVLGLLWSNSGYSYVMQDLIETLEETKKPKSIEVAKTLKSINPNDKSYDLVSTQKQMRQGAEIPANLYFELTQKLGEPKKNKKAWARWLNDPDNKYFRTGGGNI